MRRNYTGLTLIAVLCFVFVGCTATTGTGNNASVIPNLTDQVITDTSRVLEDGGVAAFKLEPGNYKLELTASGDGAEVEWIGGTCPKSKEIRQSTMTCEMSQAGQVVITNHAVMGLGKPVSITVKLTKLAP